MSERPTHYELFTGFRRVTPCDILKHPAESAGTAPADEEKEGKHRPLANLQQVRQSPCVPLIEEHEDEGARSIAQQPILTGKIYSKIRDDQKTGKICTPQIPDCKWLRQARAGRPISGALPSFLVREGLEYLPLWPCFLSRSWRRTPCRRRRNTMPCSAAWSNGSTAPLPPGATRGRRARRCTRRKASSPAPWEQLLLLDDHDHSLSFACSHDLGLLLVADPPSVGQRGQRAQAAPPGSAMRSWPDRQVVPRPPGSRKRDRGQDPSAPAEIWKAGSGASPSSSLGEARSRRASWRDTNLRCGALPRPA